MDLFELMGRYCGREDAVDPAKATALPENLREECEERAAIMEYDGGMSREEADSRALRLTLTKAAGYR